MSILRAVGIEEGSLAVFSATGGTVAVESSVVRTGSYSARCNPTTTGNGYFAIYDEADQTNFDLADAYFGFAFRADTIPAEESSEEILCVIGGGVRAIRLRCAHVTASTYTIDLYDTNGTTSLGTGTTSLSTSTWYYIEVNCDATNDDATVRIDGVVEHDAVSATAFGNTQSIRFGKETNRNGNSVDFYYDDIYVADDAFKYAGRGFGIVELGLSGNGNYTDFEPSPGPGYLDLDERPSDGSTTNVISDGTIGNAQTVACNSAASAGVSGTIHAVECVCYSSRGGAASGTARIRIRSGSTDSDTADFTINNTVYEPYAQCLDQDPATTAAWTAAGVDGVEGGFVERQASTNTTRVTAVTMEVLFTPSPPRHIKMVGHRPRVKRGSIR